MIPWKTDIIIVEDDNDLTISYQAEIQYQISSNLIGDVSVINGTCIKEYIEDIEILQVEKIYTNCDTLEQKSLGLIKPDIKLKNKILKEL